MSMVGKPTRAPKASTHQEFLWTLGKTNPDGSTEIMYLFCTKQSDCYRTIVEIEFFGTGVTGKWLASQGWKPVRVLVTADL